MRFDVRFDVSINIVQQLKMKCASWVVENRIHEVNSERDSSGLDDGKRYEKWHKSWSEKKGEM
jgi:hypothetical protein